MNVNIWLIIGLGTIVQGFLLSVAIFVKSSKNNTANILLSLFIFCVSFSMIGRIGPILSLTNSAFVMGAIMDLIIFSYGPLSYFYLKTLFNGKYSLQFKDVIHFVPFVVFLIYFSYRFFFEQHFNDSIFHRNLDIVFVFLESMAILSNAVYIYIAYRMVKSYEKRTPIQLSYLPQIKYIKIFLLLISVIIFFWFFGFISKYNIHLQFGTAFSYNIVWALISFLTFAFAYISFFESGIISIPEKIVKYEQGYFEDSYYDDLKSKLDQTILDESPFLNPKLTLSHLSISMGVNQRDLSRVINEYYGVNFYEFINNFRVDKFKQLVTSRDNNDFTIVALAYESGFNSKATFNTAFKKIMGCTPSQFIKDYRMKKKTTNS